MILQTLILAVACTGVVQNAPMSHTLYYEVGRGLIGNMWLNDNDSFYINTYVELENFRVTYSSGQITGMYCDSIDLIFEQYDDTDTFQGTFDRSFSSLSSYNLYNVDLEIENLNGNTNVTSYYLYINDIPVNAINVTLDDNYVIPYIQASITFLDDNFYTYYDYNVGNTSYQSGYERGYQAGLTDGYSEGKSDGYTEGYNEASNADSNTLAVFSGITSIALIPLNMFLEIFNFEILGLNLTNVVTALLSVACLIIILRLIFGGKKD